MSKPPPPPSHMMATFTHEGWSLLCYQQDALLGHENLLKAPCGKFIPQVVEELSWESLRPGLGDAAVETFSENQTAMNFISERLCLDQFLEVAVEAKAEGMQCRGHMILEKSVSQLIIHVDEHPLLRAAWMTPFQHPDFEADAIPSVGTVYNYCTWRAFSKLQLLSDALVDASPGYIASLMKHVKVPTFPDPPEDMTLN